MRSRPNKGCLACDGPCKEPTLDRSFYYCSVFCSRNTSRGISPLSLRETNENRKKYSNNGTQLAMCWFVIRNANEPLKGIEIMDKARELFGKRVRLKAKTFANLAPYFTTIKITKKGGVNYFHTTHPELSFQKVLKPRYTQYLYD